MEKKMLEEILGTITGVSEENGPKAVVSLQHQVVYDMDENGKPLIVVDEEESVSYSVVGLAVSNGYTTIYVRFDDYEDDEYLRFKRLIKNYENRERDNKTHLLVLTMADQKTLSNFVTSVAMMVTFDGVEPVVKFVGKSAETTVYCDALKQKEPDEDDLLGELQD